mgnify:CR=1 FL=1
MKKIVEKLSMMGETISFVESMTGGKVASELVKVSGASKVFKEAFVLYSDDTKSKRLEIDAKIILQYGVVSEYIAGLMAKKLHDLTKATLCLSITGFAENRAPNEAFIGIYYRNVLKVYHMIFKDSNDRMKNIDLCVNRAKDLLNVTLKI